ncbi:hypothetical protein [Microbacterium sp.]|uniref:hypothetical protein n=1 Tax=Microbacterium sp. TaxID=51671 RepID=UPI003F71E023
MPRRPKPLPAQLGSAFTVAEGRALGVTAARLRASDLQSTFHGVRVTVEHEPPVDTPKPLAIDLAQQSDVRRRALAYARVMASDEFFTGRTAAVLYGLPLTHDEPDLHVAVLAPRRAPRGRGVRGMKTAPQLVSIRDHEGLRMASPASVWAALAAELDERELVILGDAIVRVPRESRGRPQPTRRLASIDELRRAAYAPHRRNRPLLLGAATRVREGSMSPLETDFRLLAEDAGLPDPELDVEIRGADGSLLGISDIVYRAFRTAVEIEGDHHRTSRAQWTRDLAKYAAYAAAGWEVVRLDSHPIRSQPDRGVGVVRSVLTRRGWAG